MLIGEYIVAGIFLVSVILFWKGAVSVPSKTAHGQQDLSVKRDQSKVGLLQHGDLVTGGRHTLPFQGVQIVYVETVDAVMVASIMAAVSSNVIDVPANGSS